MNRILYLVNAFEPDAPTRLMTEIGNAARNSGRYECRVMALSRGGTFQREISDRVGPSSVIGMRSFFDWTAIRRLDRAIKKYRPDILHVMLMRPTLAGGLLARWNRGCSLLVTQHGVHEWAEGGRVAGLFIPHAFRFAVEPARALVTVSQESRNTLLRHKLPPDLVQVIPNGVNTDLFSPSLKSHRREVLSGLFPGDNPDAVLLAGAAGNLRTIKGHMSMIQAAAKLAKHIPQLRFVIWGEGPEQRGLEDAITHSALKNRFVLPGWRKDMGCALAACDIFIQPSISESFGLAAAEAMSCAVPVVASNIGGLPEIVRDGECGLLFSPGSSDDLSIKLGNLAEDQQYRHDLGQAARKRVVEFFSLGLMTDRYISVYDQLTASVRRLNHPSAI
ncbi:MAG: glycosyltransferase [bacterium]|nr:glycosyltransferase [Candidatus Sumerlaeota bacterium]